MSSPVNVLLPISEGGMSFTIYVTLSLFVIWVLWPKCRQWLLVQKIPGPPGFPIVGSGLKFHGNRAHSFQVINTWFRTYGHIFKTWSIVNLTVFVSDAEDIKTILTDKNLMDRSKYITDAIIALVGGGMLTANESKWKLHRKMVNPVFNTKALECFVEVFAQNATRLADKFDEAEGRSVDFCSNVSLITIEAICRTVIGFEGESLPGGEEGMERFHAAVVRSEDLVHERVVYPWLQVPGVKRLFTSGREMIRLREVIQSYMNKISSMGLTALTQSCQKKKCENNIFEDETMSEKKPVTMLDMLLKSVEDDDKVLSPKRLRDEIQGIMLAGLETNAIAMSFLLILLGIHENVQNEILRELDEIFQDDLRPITAEDLPRLKTLERAIKESLRYEDVIRN